MQKDVANLSTIQNQMRQLVGLYTTEKAKRLHLSTALDTIHSWITSALERKQESDYHVLLSAIKKSIEMLKEEK